MKTVKVFLVYLVFAILLTTCQQSQPQPKVVSLMLTDEQASENASQIRSEVSATVDSLLELTVWASDSLLSNPVALDMDDKGRAYVTRTNRRRTSEFDIRRHPDWETASISFQTVEDRRNFLREQFPIGNEQALEKPVDFNEDGVHDWRDLTVQSEEVHFVEDRTGDGLADYTQIFAAGFNTEITDIAGGVMAYDDDVFLAVAPDLWRLQDLDGDGYADQRTSLMHGFQVHIGFGGHNMSGVIMGPDGRVYWGIGDIGFNGTDQNGRQWIYPNQGVIARCNPDGSDFEIYAAGLRNTHEFVFDAYGNLISVDNDGDHPGESERLVYITNGSDSGWRINWQFGKYRDPNNNTYKVWMDEGLNLPRFEGQAAHITPCIRNYENGPTGMVYNPGGALSRAFANHFFVVEFNGNPARSGLHTFTLKQDGATFAFESGRKVLGGILPTGLDVGPGGALYLTDWIDGWEGMGYGRIWKLDTKSKELEVLRKETAGILQKSFDDAESAQLTEWLGHSDMRVRQRAQFSLVKRGQEGLDLLVQATSEKANQLRRIHGIWGIAQMARQQIEHGQHLTSLLADHDAEIRAQAAKMIGDVRYPEAGQQLISLLQDPSKRVQFFAAEAIGRTKDKRGFSGLVDMLAANNDEDAYLRHAGSLALSRLAMIPELAALHQDARSSVKLAAVLALRRLGSAAIVDFLNDQDEYLITEVARAINDDWSIPDALPALAELLNRQSWSTEALLRRIINANLRVGGPEHIQRLIDFSKSAAAIDMRCEAIDVLGVWPDPSPLDRVDGRFRGEISRPINEIVAKAGPALVELIEDRSPAIRTAALQSIAKLKLKQGEAEVARAVASDIDPEVRAQALQTLAQLEPADLRQSIELALKDPIGKVRVEALRSLPAIQMDEQGKVELLNAALIDGTLGEKQVAIEGLANLEFESAKSAITGLLQSLVDGKIDAQLHLEVIQLAEANPDPELTSLIQKYRDQFSDLGTLADYQECIEGGDAKKGFNILVRNNAAQCLKCHAISGYGGVAGPALDDIGLKLTSEAILESLVEPSATLAAGYGVVTIELQNSELISGILKAEDQTTLIITDSNGEDVSVAKEEIKERLNAASSMPDMKSILNKGELRDLVAFLKTLEGQGLMQ